MTKRKLEALVELWRGRLGLSTWKIEIVWDEPSASDTRATIWRSTDYDEAKIYFAREWAEWLPRVAEQIVVHELLHLVLRDVEFVLDLLEGHLHRDVDQLIERSHRHHVEQAVDRLAYRLVELMGEV